MSLLYQPHNKYGLCTVLAVHRVHLLRPLNMGRKARVSKRFKLTLKAYFMIIIKYILKERATNRYFIRAEENSIQLIFINPFTIIEPTDNYTS